MEQFNKEFVISSAYGGSRAELGPAQGGLIYQDCFTDFLDYYHISNARVRREYGCYWVITRNDITYYRMPQWNETVYATVFVARKACLFFELYTVLNDANGETVSTAHQQLCLLDCITHKLMPQSTLPELNAITKNIPPDITPGRFENPKWSPDGAPTFVKTVLPHDVDSNGHMNNIAYITTLLDAFPVRETEQRGVAQLRVEYVNECFEGEQIEVFRADKDAHTVNLLIRAQDGRIAVLGQVDFSDVF